MAGNEIAAGFGERLKRAREEMGLTLRELGAEAGINYSQVSRYEQGVALPRPKVLQRLSVVLGMPIQHLRDGEEVVTVPVGDLERLRVTFTSDMYLLLKAEAEAEGMTVEQMVVLLAKEHLARVASELGSDDFAEEPEPGRRRLTDFVRPDSANPRPKRKR